MPQLAKNSALPRLTAERHSGLVLVCPDGAIRSDAGHAWLWVTANKL